MCCLLKQAYIVQIEIISIIKVWLDWKSLVLTWVINGIYTSNRAFNFYMVCS